MRTAKQRNPRSYRIVGPQRQIDERETPHPRGRPRRTGRAAALLAEYPRWPGSFQAYLWCWRRRPEELFAAYHEAATRRRGES